MMTSAPVTRVLPALEDRQPESPDARQGGGSGQPILSVWLQGHDYLQLWEDRVVAPDRIFPLDEWFGARLATDPRAPLAMVDPPIAVALLSHSEHWTTFVPHREEDVWHLLFAIRQACRARGITPIGIDDGLSQPPPVTWAAREPVPTRPARSLAARLASQPLTAVPQPALAGPGAPAQAPTEPMQPTPPSPTPVPIPPPAFAPVPTWVRGDVQWAPTTPRAAALSAPTTQAFTPSRRATPTGFSESDAVLAAISHLSLLFLPVLLPGIVWLALRESTPHVAQHARQAAIFQLLFYVVELPLFAYAVAAALAHHPALAVVATLLLLLGAGAYCAFAAATEALRGRPARYLALWRR
jgi:hypothetical protein